MTHHQQVQKDNPNKVQRETARKPNQNHQFLQDIAPSEIQQSRLDPGRLLYLQRIIGNSAVQIFLAEQADQDPVENHEGASLTVRSVQQNDRGHSELRRSMKTILAAPAKRTYNQFRAENTIQRREDNPFATGASHDGWSLTGHHIIGHAKLTDALDALNPEQKKDILKRSIPAVLTKEMLKNLKVKVPDNADEGYLANIRARLVDMNDNDPVEGIKMEDIRGSFFEWQHGNQFSGPNTSIRTEPTNNKSDMDFDGQYFSDDFDDLEREGKGLYGELNAREKLKGDDVEGKAENANAIYERLKTILAITVNKSNEDFDPAKWKEIGSLSVLEELAANKKLNRPHMMNYAFFKFPAADTHTQGMVGTAKYDMLRATNAGNSEFSYGTIPKVEAQAKGTNIFIPIENAKKQIPTTEVQKSLTSILADLKITVRPKDGNFEVTIPKEAQAFNSNKMLRLEGYKGAIIYTENTGDQFTLTEKQLGINLKMDVPTGISLFTYLQEKGAPVSSYLPKALYDKFKTIPDLENLLSKALIDGAKYDKEVRRLSGLKNATPNQLKRLALFMRKSDNAAKNQAKYKADIAKLRQEF